MKKFILMLLFFLPIAVSAQTLDSGESTDYSSAFATFAALVAIVPFVVQALKKAIPPITNSSLAEQIVSWITGIILTMFGWFFHLGFLVDIEWYYALLYGLGVSLAANGIFDTGIIEWIISLFVKKRQ